MALKIFNSAINIEILDISKMNYQPFSITGIMPSGMPITVNVKNFLPYFYIDAFENDLKKINLESIQKELNSEDIKVINITFEKKTNFYRYNEEKNFIKIEYVGRNIQRLKDKLNGGINILYNNEMRVIKFITYELTIPNLLRIMHKLNIKGMHYINIKKFTILNNNSAIYLRDEMNNMCFCGGRRRGFIKGMNIMPEIDKSPETYLHEKVLKYTPVEEQIFIETSFDQIDLNDDDSIPPLTTFSFDIECVNKDNLFPKAEIDPVIQIGITINFEQNKKCNHETGGDEVEPVITQTIFSLNTIIPIPNVNAYTFKNESDMLLSFVNYLNSINPDIILGYNSNGFDLKYIFDRLKIFKQDFFIGRTYFKKNEKNELGVNFSSNKKIINNEGIANVGIEYEKYCRTGMKIYSKLKYSKLNLENKKINISRFSTDIYGRLNIDLLPILRRDYRLSSYSLNAVSIEFLNSQKEDVPYNQMYNLFMESAITRHRLAQYCVKDTLLPLNLFKKLIILLRGIELTRLTSIPVDWHYTRGPATKCHSLILKIANENNFILPDGTNETAGYEGAVVISPSRGFYNEPVGVLDFASLYPSIIIAHNLCYTTYENKIFVSKKKREGLLPIILKKLLSERKKIRKIKTDDKFYASILDARQHAMKIMANSIYGFTGAVQGRLPLIAISQQVTFYGRQMINETIQLVEKYVDGAKVIYGDTDSVMFTLKEKDLRKFFNICTELAEKISKDFEDPIKLEFEKVYFPFLLINKKRYAGNILNEIRGEIKRIKIDTKGIETVRRDNCRLVRDLITQCLDKILIEGDIEGAKDAVIQTVDLLYENKIDLSHLIITKQLTKFDYTNKQPHVEVANRLGNKVIGDRIKYVMINSGKKAFEKAEDPLIVLNNNIPIDVTYYIEQQLKKPIMRIFESICDANELFQNRKRIEIIGGRGIMSKFLKKVIRCLECKSGSGIICKDCLNEETFSKHYLTIIRNVETNISNYSKCWAECQRCQGSVLNEVICENTECDIYFMRIKAMKELEKEGKTVDLLEKLKW